jgi:hypothetical protein
MYDSVDITFGQMMFGAEPADVSADAASLRYTTLASFVRDVPLSDHVQSASVATAMQAVNAVPAVCAAAPGFVTMADIPFVWNRAAAR